MALLSQSINSRNFSLTYSHAFINSMKFRFYKSKCTSIYLQQLAFLVIKYWKRFFVVITKDLSQRMCILSEKPAEEDSATLLSILTLRNYRSYNVHWPAMVYNVVPIVCQRKEYNIIVTTAVRRFYFRFLE